MKADGFPIRTATRKVDAGEATKRLMGMPTTDKTDHDVILALNVAEGCSRAQLEGLSIEILEIVEEHAAHIALGPVVSAQFAPPVIELDFDVQATSHGELFERVAELMRIIERHGPVRCVTGASVGERELVPA